MKNIWEIVGHRPEDSNVYHRVWNMGLNPLRDTPLGQSIITTVLMLIDALAIYTTLNIALSNWKLSAIITVGAVVVIDLFMSQIGNSVSYHKIKRALLGMLAFAGSCLVVYAFIRVCLTNANVETFLNMSVPDVDKDPSGYTEYLELEKEAYGDFNAAYELFRCFIPIGTTLGILFFNYAGRPGIKLYDGMKRYRELEEQEYDIQRKITELKNMPELSELLEKNSVDAQIAERMWLNDLKNFVDEQKLEIATNVAVDYSATDFFFHSKNSQHTT